MQGVTCTLSPSHIYPESRHGRACRRRGSRCMSFPLYLWTGYSYHPAIASTPTTMWSSFCAPRLLILTYCEPNQEQGLMVEVEGGGAEQAWREG
eukprot:scaffold20493_cov125-Isochrysis_galbana.AAC.6